MDTVLAEAMRLEALDVPYVMVTVVRTVRPTSATVGSRALVAADQAVIGFIGGECTRNMMLEVAGQALQDGKPRLLILSPDASPRFSESDAQVIVKPMTCHSGGTVELFIEPHVQDPVLLVVGKSPIATAVAAMAEQLPFVLQTVSLEDNEGPDLGMLQIQLRDAAQPGCYVVVATMGQYDDWVIESLKDMPLEYLGVVASPRRGQILKERLADDPDQYTGVPLAAPAGLNIGGRHPGEIAVSILSEITRLRRQNDPAGDSGSRASQSPAQVRDPVCEMHVNLQTTPYRVEWNGEMWGFCCLSCQESFLKHPEQYVGGQKG